MIWILMVTVTNFFLLVFCVEFLCWVLALANMVLSGFVRFSHPPRRRLRRTPTESRKNGIFRFLLK